MLCPPLPTGEMISSKIENAATSLLSFKTGCVRRTGDMISSKIENCALSLTRRGRKRKAFCASCCASISVIPFLCNSVDMASMLICAHVAVEILAQMSECIVAALATAGETVPAGDVDLVPL